MASAGTIDYHRLPYNQAVLDLVMEAKRKGRRVYLATAVDRKHADRLAEHLGVFDGVFASEGSKNLAGAAKAEILVETFGKQGFDYVGNSWSDLAIWREAATVYAVNVSARVAAELQQLFPNAIILSYSKIRLAPWIKIVRPHQYAKNALLFVPVLTSHSFDIQTAIATVAAFVSFCLCASSVYIFNDISDVRSDRAHPTKRSRPIASGDLTMLEGVVVFPVLLLLSCIVARAISLAFFLVLVGYFSLTTPYSISLKRKMIVDIVVLAMLYTARIVAGAVAIGVELSQWLAMFSLMFFVGLALVKRYGELYLLREAGLPNPKNRNYRIADLPVIGALAAAAGMNAVTIFTLYVSSPAVGGLYARPNLLWMIAPVLVFWLGRLLLMMHRGYMHDDPVVFALRDKVSWYCLLVILVIIGVSL